MSAGLPDFYSPIAVGLQSLAELIVRNTYGAANRSNFAGIVTAGTLDTLITVAGKGVIYGGQIDALVTNVTAQKTDNPILVIDGETLHNLDWDNMFLRNMTKAGIVPIYLTKYDEVNDRLVLRIGFGITFETSAVIQYDNNGANDVTIGAELFYATI